MLSKKEYPILLYDKYIIISDNPKEAIVIPIKYKKSLKIILSPVINIYKGGNNYDRAKSYIC